MPQAPPHLLLVEDDAHFAAWVLHALQAHFPAARLHHAATCAQARAALEGGALAPLRLAIVDLNLPDGSGVDVIGAVADSMPGTPILVITAVEEPAVALAAIRAGAAGYIVKATMDADLVRTVGQVLAGGSPITPAIARLLLLEFQQQGLAAAAAASAAADGRLKLADKLLEKLTERETDVLRLLARGYGNKEIAAKLGFSANTADTHVRSIYLKLSVNSRAQLRSMLA
ncbi:LuxR C-terminal-related transcriptional regulator [Massilia sp. PWRC2]|uniref:LuxR C-terminal-related transcriptional regulator n=1 Tax=Massilia sp. PWRC2 TaxID=2804626 RepID=UPI003CED28D8